MLYANVNLDGEYHLNNTFFGKKNTNTRFYNLDLKQPTRFSGFAFIRNEEMFG